MLHKPSPPHAAAAAAAAVETLAQPRTLRSDHTGCVAKKKKKKKKTTKLSELS